jgi:hypothetical protein
MTEIATFLSLLTLNVNHLNSLIKTQRVVDQAKKLGLKLSMVYHTCNPNNSGSGDQEDHGMRTPQTKN